MKGSNLDNLILVLGRRNHFKIFVLILLACNYIPVVFNHLVMSFYGSVPTHHCQVILRKGDTNDINNGSLFEYWYENETVLRESADDCDSHLYLKSGMNISGQWNFTSQYGEKTIVSEWDLVCGDKHFASLATTIYFIGVMLGGLLFGFVSDCIGRLPVILFTLYTAIVIGTGLSFVPNYSLFVILRFVIGVLMQGLQTSSYIAAMEFFLPSQRPSVGVVMECFWGVTVMILPGLAFLLPNWRHLQLAITLPSILAVFYLCVLPESLRWLVMKGKFERAEQLVKRISRWSKTDFPSNEWDLVRREMENNSAKSRQNYHFLHLIQTPKLRKRTLVLFYVWLTIATGYFGLTFMITTLPGNKYLNFFIGGAVEIVAYALSLCVMNRFGRKKPLMFYFMSAAIFCIAAAVIPPITLSSGFSLQHLSTSLAIAGRFATAGLFSVIFVYTTELYPTVIRNIGMGTCTVWARLGGVIAPQINQLGGNETVQIPILVFGCMMLFGGAFIFLLPETHSQKLPDTIDDVEAAQKKPCSVPGTELETMIKTCALDENNDVQLNV